MSQTDLGLPTAGSSKLRGNLGVGGISFMVLAAAAPMTVIGGPMIVGFSVGNGAGLTAMYIFATLVLLAFVVGFITMTPFVRYPGAFYSYVKAGIGQRTGTSAGYTALLCYIMLLAGVYPLFGTGLGGLVESWGGPTLPWYVWALVCFLLVSWLGYRNIEISGKILSVLLIAEVLIVIVFDVVVFAQGGGKDGITTAPFTPSVIFSGAPGNAMIFALISFLGIEATAIFRSEARDPDRTVPRAMIISLVGIGLFYSISCWAITSAAGNDIQAQATEDPTLFFTLAHQFLGQVGHDIANVMFVTSAGAAALTFHNISARYTFTLANRKLLPAFLGQAHRKHGSPHSSSIVISVLMVVFVLFSELTHLDPILEYYTWTAALGTFAYGVLLLSTSIAVLVSFPRNRQVITSPTKSIVMPVLATIGMIVVMILMFSNIGLLVGTNQIAMVIILGLLVIAVISGPIVIPVLGSRLPADDTSAIRVIPGEPLPFENE